MSSRCEIRVLGTLRAFVEGEEIALGGPRPRLLLALLVVAAGRPVSLERLIDDLYDNEPPTTARKSVQVQVHHLRRAFAPVEAIVTTADGYRLDESVVDVDALAFVRAVETAIVDAPAEPAAAAAALSRALELWRGAPYGDLGSRPAVRPEVARLVELRLRAVEKRIDVALRVGRHADVLGELEMLTREHPFREELRVSHMLALYRSNRQAEALAVYDRTREQLVEELGIEPSSQLRALHVAVLAQDPSLDLPERSAVAGEGDASVARTLRGYELLELVGQGPRGEVRRAHHVSTGHEVAIKVLRSEFANRPGFVRRFELELQYVAGLSHPWVAPVEDHWRDPEGAYLVMPLYPDSLATVLAAGPLQPTAAVRVVDQVGAALAHAHRHGVVHGNLKPTNVLLDEHGDPHLADVLVADVGAGAGSSADLVYAAPERLVGAPPDARSDVYDLTLMLYELLTGRRVGLGETPPPFDHRRLGTPVALDEVLARGAARSPAERFARVEDLTRAVRQVTGLDVASRRVPVATDPWQRNPFKGLRAFGEGDAADFHGRASVVEHLVAALGSSNVVTLVGPSGSGKSSVVKAGLVPAVRAGALGDGAGWVVAKMFPGAYPFEELEAALLGVASDRPTDLLGQLRGDDRGLLRAAKQLLPDDETHLLLVVDQFEELFALVQHDPTRQRFLMNLVEVARDDRSRVRVVLTLRADFLDGPLQHPAFGEVLQDATVTLSMPAEESLAIAISRPAHDVGLELEPGLVPAIVGDVIGQPGGLPLLQYCLTELVEQGGGTELTLAAYDAIGRASGALARRAEQLFDRLSVAGREAARHVFLRLVAVSPDTDDTRRRVRLTRLTTLAPDLAAVDEVVEEFGAHRLLTFDHDPITRGPTVEVAHEALIDAWPRYRTWIDERRGDLMAERRLEAAAGEWDEHGREPDFLLRGERLQEAEAWAAATDLPLPTVLRTYLVDSRALADRLHAEELEHARRAASLRRRSRWLAASAVAAIVAVVAGAFAWTGRAELTAEADRAAEASRLARAAMASLGEDPTLAASLGLAGVLITAETGAVNPAVLDALHWALQDGGVTFPATSDTPVAVRPSPDGLRGVFLLPVDDVVTLARDQLARPLTDEECGEHFPGDPCPDPTVLPPVGLVVDGGDEAYRALTDPDAPLTGASVHLASWIPDSDDLDITLMDTFLLDALSRTIAGSGIAVTHEQVDLYDERVLDRADVRADVVLALERSFLTWAAANGDLHDLSGFIDRDDFAARYGPQWTGHVSVAAGEGPRPGLYGVPTGVIMRSLVTYNRVAFDQLGYDVPTTLDGLVELTTRAVEDGHAPWCWAGRLPDQLGPHPVGDWVSGLLLAQAGPDVVAAVASGEQPFASPEVRAAFDLLGDLTFPRGVTAGRTSSVLDVDYYTPAFRVAMEEPDCLMMMGSHIPATLLPRQEQLDRIDVFPLPSADGGTPSVLADSTVAMLHVDSPENRAVIEAMATPDFLRSYVDAAPVLAPVDPTVDTTVQDPLYLQAQPGRLEARIIELAQTATREGRIVFTPSVRLPLDALPTLWDAPTSWYATDGSELEPVLEAIDEAVSSAER